MTTSVTVTVPEAADYDVLVNFKVVGSGYVTEQKILHGGETATYHIYGDRYLSVKEVPRTK